jgi:restriction system protein
MTPKNTWMVRSDGGNALSLFEEGIVGIHYGIPEKLSGKTLDEIRQLYKIHNPGDSKGKAANAVGMLDRIANKIQIGDGVVTYDPGTRHYWIGRIASDYFLEPGDADLPHRRKVTWDEHTVSRDDLSIEARNSLGSTMSLFSVSPEIWQEMIAAQHGEKAIPDITTPEEELKEELTQEKKSLIEKARERLKDKIVSLDDSQMEELLAAALRAMGFRTRVSAKGPDRGVDVLASPDGLGLQEPRIKCEVKHRKNTVIGAQEVRSFLGALRSGDRGIYLSTGGFTREARYESERATVPLSLMDLDDLARLIETHYEKFDTEGRGLLPLTKVYWPAD